MAQSVFERYEKKYMLDEAQCHALADTIAGYMEPDRYGQYTIRSLYYDTDGYDLIRRSLEKPVYKEKLRLRCYGTPGGENPVFLELKKKFKGVVYKRRTALSLEEAKFFLHTGLCGEMEGPNEQILGEIGYFMQRQPLEPKILICYDRTALRGRKDQDLRLTFDENIRYRQTELAVDKGCWGTGLLAPGARLMEIKVRGAFPIWLSRALSELEIFPVSFSKYGTCYRQIAGSGQHEKGGKASA